MVADLASNYRTVADLGSNMLNGETRLGTVERLLVRVLEDHAWQEFVLPTGEVVEHRSWPSFVRAPSPRGLGTTEDVVDRFVGHDPHVLTLLKAAKAGKPGRPRHDETRTESVRNTDEDELHAQRLAAERPDLLAAVAAGERSLHAAAVEAGYRRRRVSVRTDSADAIARTLRRAVAPDVLRHLVELLTEEAS